MLGHFSGLLSTQDGGKPLGQARRLPLVTTVFHTVDKLHAGFNTVRFEVTKVGEPLVGETVELDVQAPLGFRWLWFAMLLWPVFIIVQVISAACLLS